MTRFPLTPEGYQSAKRWVLRYDPEALQDFEKELGQDGLTFVTFVNSRLDSCPLCNGDCGSASPPVSDCPMESKELIQWRSGNV